MTEKTEPDILGPNMDSVCCDGKVTFPGDPLNILENLVQFFQILELFFFFLMDMNGFVFKIMKASIRYPSLKKPTVLSCTESPSHLRSCDRNLLGLKSFKAVCLGLPFSVDCTNSVPMLCSVLLSLVIILPLIV